MIENICGYQLNIFVASFSCQHARAWWCLCSVQPLCLSLCVKRPNRILQMNHQNPLVSPKSSVHPQSPVCTNSAKTDSSLTDEILITTKMKKSNSFRIHKYNLGIQKNNLKDGLCPACRTTLVATRFRVAVICPIIQVPHCIRVFFYFVWFVFINHIFHNIFFIMNYVPIVTFWIFTYNKIWILSIMFCFIWSYWIIYFLACLEVSWRVVS